MTAPAAISVAVPRSAIGRRLVRIRAFLRHSQLDTALAAGADPWSAGDLMARAVQLGALSHRRKLSAGLVSLVEIAQHRRADSPYLKVRRGVVLGQREALLELSERLAQIEPVDVAVVAQLTLLLSDPTSPVLTGGGDPAGLEHVTTRCLERVAEAD
jgi:hypothetical protein